MRILLTAALLLLSSVFAYAADNDSSTAPATSAGSTYTNATYDFSLWLPDGGTIADKDKDPKWDYDENTVFTWVDEKLDLPVFLVMGSALALDTDATDDDVSNFVQGLTDADNNKANNTEVEKVSDVFQVGNRGWVSVLFKDNSDTTPGEFEIFVTRQGVNIYAIAFHYTDGSDKGSDFTQQILASFATSKG